MRKSKKLNKDIQKNENKIISLPIIVILVVLTIIVILPIFYNTRKTDN